MDDSWRKRYEVEDDNIMDISVIDPTSNTLAKYDDI